MWVCPAAGRTSGRGGQRQPPAGLQTGPHQPFKRPGGPSEPVPPQEVGEILCLHRWWAWLLCLLVNVLSSLNADKRREELLLVGHQNQGIYQRIVSRQSEYCRQLWLEDWKRAERLRHSIMRYPRGPAEKQVRSNHDCPGG